MVIGSSYVLLESLWKSGVVGIFSFPSSSSSSPVLSFLGGLSTNIIHRSAVKRRVEQIRVVQKPVKNKRGRKKNKCETTKKKKVSPQNSTRSEKEGGKEFDELDPVLVKAPASSVFIFPSTVRKRAYSIDNVATDIPVAIPTAINVLKR